MLVFRLLLVAMLAVLGVATTLAQQPAAAPRIPRQLAQADPTGYWVAQITEDWRWRMMTPPKGDYLGVPLNDAGRKIGDGWDLARDAANGNLCKSDVIAAGHVIEELTFPTMAEGGSLAGTIDALNRILLMTVASWRSQGGTQVIPVRGRPYDEGDVAEYRDMVTIVRDRLQDAIARGRTLAQVKADRLSQDYDRRYGSVPGPGSTEAFIDAAYQSLSARRGTN